MKGFLRILTAAATSLALASCAEIDDSETRFVAATETASFAFDGANPVIPVAAEVRVVSVSGVRPGQRVFVARVNPTGGVISGEGARFVESAAGISARTERSAAAEERATIEEGRPVSEPTFAEEFESARSAAANGASATASATAVGAAAGATRRIVVDHSVSEDGTVGGFGAETFSLAAAGKSCLVWTDGSLGTARAAELARAFDGMCGAIRATFGSEGDFLADGGGRAETAESPVNVVVYDIGGDGKASVSGYFHSKDLNSPRTDGSSNGGKFIYIDSLCAERTPGLAVSTLAHEFQHMIFFGRKVAGLGLRNERWFNEMMSMLCEDLVQDMMGISDHESPKCRLDRFVRDCNGGGLEFRSGGELLSYASVYAFGAWLSRQYGGRGVIREMAANAHVGMESVTAAVESVTGRRTSAEEILCRYAQACVFNAAIEYDYPTFNQSADELSAIDLWSYGRGDGPRRLPASARREIRPFGITISEVGEAAAQDLSITLNDESHPDQRTFVFIQ